MKNAIIIIAIIAALAIVAWAMSDITCPKCKSKNVAWSNGVWICWDCGEIFTGLE